MPCSDASTKGVTVFDGTPKQLDARVPAGITHNRLDHIFRELTSFANRASSKKRSGIDAQ